MSDANQALIEVHGVSPASTPEQRVAIGKAVLIAVGGGGSVSPKEMERLFSIATAYGASPDAIEAWRRFDHAGARLSDHLHGDARLARHLAYETIRICRAEGDAKRARARATEAGRLLGVHPSLVTALLGIVDAEDALQKARASIEAGGTGRASGPPEAAAAGLREIAEKEAVLRRTRISLMEDEGPRPRA